MPPAAFHTYMSKVLRAARRVDAEATPAQRDGGNARVGKVYCHGIELAIEWPKGTMRKGVGQDGKEWSRPMRAHYGRINRTTSPHDGDPVDFYMGEHPQSQLVFVISQLNARGDLDEHKCVLGSTNVNEAKKIYLDHYPSWWKDERLGEVRGYTMEQFKKWLASDNPVKNRWDRKEASCDPRHGVKCPHCGSNKTFGARATEKHKDGRWCFANVKCVGCGNGFGYDFDTGETSTLDTNPERARSTRTD